jgi:ornithine cyclodeaminase/alanine dehydrogenase
MDCIWLTARRTGAATALAAKYLAREDSKVLGILGCGVQGRSNLEALVEICQNIEEVKAYDINKANEEKYVQEMARKHELKITSAGSPKRAVQGCDIVVTSGPILKKPEPLIVKSWFRDGGLACPLDFDSYWKTEAMHSMDKFCTDDGEQLAYYRSQGYFADIPSVYADLGEIVTLKKAGRESNRERIMTMNLGLAIEDGPLQISLPESCQEKDWDEASAIESGLRSPERHFLSHNFHVFVEDILFFFYESFHERRRQHPYVRLRDFRVQNIFFENMPPEDGPFH